MSIGPFLALAFQKRLKVTNGFSGMASVISGMLGAVLDRLDGKFRIQFDIVMANSLLTITSYIELRFFWKTFSCIPRWALLCLPGPFGVA